MKRYLYGLSVHGIQSYIFSSNKLREIAGASELVENICTEFFKSKVSNFQPNNLLMGAAGKVKYIFDSERDCNEVVRNMPYWISQFAPGISSSQAVEIFEDNELVSAMDVLEGKLQIQRNVGNVQSRLGFIGVLNSRRTGLAAIQYDERKDDFLDIETKRKLEAVSMVNFQKMTKENIPASRTPFELSELKDSKSWIAVIHADGNGLGQILQNLGASLGDLKQIDKVKSGYKQFSLAIEEATVGAVSTAYAIMKDKWKENEIIPIRPILIGGDDVTVIIRADLALEFTHLFLCEFEKESARTLAFLKDYNVKNFSDGISACAGIAYVKHNYPFHYAVELADELCREAKNFVKSSVPLNGNVSRSALSFFKVQDSFVDPIEELRKRTMTKANVVDYRFGPYLVHRTDTFPSSEDLLNQLSNLNSLTKANEKKISLGKLREVISKSYESKDHAIFLLKRMKQMNWGLYDDLNLDDIIVKMENNEKLPLLDLMNLYGFQYKTSNE
jgi:hypothetical protein